MQMKLCLHNVTTLPHPVGVARAITTGTGIPVFYRLAHSNVASNSRRAMRTVCPIEMYSFSLAYSTSTCRCLWEISVEMRFQN